MILLHGSYLQNRTFWIWGETSAENSAGLEVYRYALSESALSELLSSAFNLQQKRIESITGWLPTVADQPVPSSPIIAPYPSGRAMIRPWKIPAAFFKFETVLQLLISLDDSRIDTGIFYGPDFIFWSQLARFSLKLVAEQKYLPVIREEEGSWMPVLIGDEKTQFETFVRSIPPACRAFTSSHDEAPSGGSAHFVENFTDTVLRYTVMKTRISLMPGENTLHDRWLRSLVTPQPKLKLAAGELPALEESLEKWTAPMIRRMAFQYRLAFRLEEPTSRKEFWFIRYLLQKENEPSLMVPVEHLWQKRKSIRNIFGQELGLAQENTLIALAQASKIDSLISLSLRQSQPAGYETDASGASQFLESKAWILQDAGYGVLLPSWWGKKGTTVRLGLKAVAKSKKTKAFPGVGSDVLLDFDWQLAIGDQDISMDELRALAKLKVPLVKFRGKWVQLKPEEIQAALDFWKSKSMKQGSLMDLVRLSVGAEMISPDLPIIDIEAQGWVSDFLLNFKEQAQYQTLEPPKNFYGTLREYQIRGFSWLAFMKTFGLGACLADDMGLGKTIQTIALLLTDRNEGVAKPHLQINDLPFSRIRTPPRETTLVTETIQRTEPPLRPPAFSKFPGLRFDSTCHGFRLLTKSEPLIIYIKFIRHLLSFLNRYRLMTQSDQRF